ncbi:filament-like plant protein 3 [Punica granatum]|uniref:Filament-like plant protein 3 n=2 Tax=Punica granatum TaxID=22663 RepID=A0A6P8D241_PUNGR|nr:filament-like plant protein 3 [Punica granatum]XP_031388489.1 filament-like plant protein 3 [Punica granatum]XP_031388491.1 filament-like plant protein 3 [Punica granatum]OWM69415.1 hypothetical protein CDL15_Pgr013876 [Punica granatum]PKI72656.1 hypothetical protein CRG98_007033 [Punica granatum]
MDRRSWLWRRKSSEKSLGETESSGSISSHSERFSDEQAFAAHSSQSLEVTSKVVVAEEDVNDRVETLSERLSAALLNINAKEELVKQHAKVAEEAVTGWEKAENEVSVLKKQLESATERNSSLENRVTHLDGALKECLRQLRQSREEQEVRINEVIAEKTREWELINSDLRPKLDAAERQNSALKSELLSRVAELEVRTIELDLSTKAAETASKQNLESIKKVAKLEAEIRRLKAEARKAASASSFCIESFTDSQSDAGEQTLAVENSARNEFDPVLTRRESRTFNLVKGLNNWRNGKTLGKNLMVPSLEADLMDDFLEMERLAGLPDAEAGSSRIGARAMSDQFRENQLRSELDAMINRTSELEEEIEKKDAEKAELEAALTQFQEQLGKSGSCLKVTEVRLKEIESRTTELEEQIEKKEAEKAELQVSARQFHEQLDKSENCLKEAEKRLTELETRLSVVEKLKGGAEEKMKATESQLRDAAAKMESLRDKVKSLEEELGLERADKLEKEEKCRTLEEEISRMRKEVELQQNAELLQVAPSSDELKLKQVQELAAAASKFAECQKTITSLGQKLKSLASLEDFLVESDEIPGLMNEEDSEHPQNTDGPNESDPSDSNLLNRESDYTGGNSTPEKARERGGTNPSQNRNVPSEKSRHGIGKFPSRGRKIGS